RRRDLGVDQAVRVALTVVRVARARHAARGTPGAEIGGYDLVVQLVPLGVRPFLVRHVPQSSREFARGRREPPVAGMTWAGPDFQRKHGSPCWPSTSSGARRTSRSESPCARSLRFSPPAAAG